MEQAGRGLTFGGGGGRGGPVRRWFAALALLLGSLLGAPLGAQSPAPPPPELFFKPAEVLQAVLSPSGRRLAISTTIGGERIGVFVWDLAGGIETGERPTITQAVRFSDIDVRRFQWANDEQIVFDVYDRSEGSGNQASPGLYVTRFDGEGLRQLVSPRFPAAVRAVSSSLGRYALHPNHRLLAVPRHGNGQEVLIGELLGSGRELTSVRPLWLSLSSGRTRDASAGGPAGAIHWLFDGVGEARLALVQEAGRSRLHWRAPGQGAWRVLNEGPDDALRFVPSFMADDGTLYVTRFEGRGGHRVLARFDTARGQPEPEALVSVKGFDYQGVPVHGRAGQPLLGLHLQADAETTVWFDERMKRLQQEAEQRFPGSVVRLDCRRCGEADMVAVARVYSDRNPGQLWLYRAAPPARADGTPGSTWRAISHVRQGIDARRMAQVDLHRIAARDGRELPVWVTLPAGHKPRTGSPAVVLLHGGPWVRGGYWHWSELEQFLASRGYVVISPEFRGSTGYGRAHYEAGFRQWGQAMQDDVADATRWAQAQGLADRFCVAGASYGGYSTLMGLVRDPDLYRCGVAIVAVTDPFLYLQGSWWIDDDISSYGRRYSLPRLVGDPERDADMLKAASPLEQAARITRPLMLMHGGRDLRVPVQHAERLRDALRAAGREPEWVVYPDEGHGFLRLDNRVDMARRIEAFLARHLAP